MDSDGVVTKPFSFENNDKGGAAAIAVIILVMVALVTLFQFVMQKKWVRYV